MATGQSSRGALAVFFRLLAVARPYWSHLAGCMIISLLAVPLSLLTPIPLKIAVDNVLSGQTLPPWALLALPEAVSQSESGLLAFAALLMVAIMLLLHVQGLLGWLLQTYVGEKLAIGFRGMMFDHVQRLSLAYHDATGTADSTYRIQYDAPSIQHVVVHGVIPLATSVATLAGMIWVTAAMDWQLAIVALGVVPVLYGITVFFGERLRARWTEIKQSESAAMAVVQEALSSVRVVKAFGAEDREHKRFIDRSRTVVQKQLNIAFMQGNYDLLVGLTLAVGSALGLFLGVRHVQGGVLTLGQLLMVMTYLAMLYEPLRTLSSKIADLQGGLASAQRAFALLDQEPEVVERPDAVPIARAQGAIVFENVNFSYATGQPVLREVNLEIRAGAKVGIQGTTGAGKTTLMSLLTRLYDPGSGRVLLDGVDLRDYRLDDLRAQFAIVLQETILFSASIGENIAYGRPGATEEEIIAAARAANAHEFIVPLPDGYRTQVGERGMMLSGGERQRISLARAFLRDSPVLILDEPTSSIDVATEAQIVTAMERLTQGRTTIMIAHRLSTLESCDMRLKVEGGRVVDLSGQKLPELVGGLC